MSRRNKRRIRKAAITCICSRCHDRTEQRPGDLYAAARLRCLRCGGPINRLRDEGLTKPRNDRGQTKQENKYV